MLLSELRVFFEKSLAFKRAGPFPMVKKVRPSACELEIPKMWKSLHPVINESKLKPYHYPTFAQQQESSPTVIALSQEGAIQEVERILNSRRQGDELQYLVKWQGQPFEKSTWEDRRKIIKEASQLCQNFYKKPPRHIQDPHNLHTWKTIQRKSRRHDLRGRVML